MRAEVMASSPYISFKEGADHFRVSRSGLYTLIEKGIVPKPLSIGGKRMFTREMIARADKAIEEAASA